jgi:hypothetical protein
VARTMKSRVRAAILGAGAVAICTAVAANEIAVAHANPVPANCSVAPWGFLGSKTRLICDGPIRPDGSWMRTRIIGIPAHYANPSSSCSGGQYYSNCTYYPGGYVPEQDSDNETYPVRRDTVLPDEPGHMPDPAPAPPAPTPPPT